MTISLHLETFHGQPVAVLSNRETTLPDPKSHAVRVCVDWNGTTETYRDVFTQLLSHPDIEHLRGLLIGYWGRDASSAEAVEMLCAAADQLPSLRHLFVGEITYDENEISWIEQCNLGVLFDAFPLLESLHTRGGIQLTFGDITHRHLRTFHVEDGGMPVQILRQIAAADAPELEDLAVMLGRNEYGWDGTADDVRAFVETVHERFPKLKRFGLKNMDGSLTDEIAAYLATHPLLDRLKELDLSLGTLGDAGTRALIDGGKLPSLERLDVTHNYLSEEMRKELEGLSLEVETDPEDAEVYDWDEDGNDIRYCAVGE